MKEFFGQQLDATRGRVQSRFSNLLRSAPGLGLQEGKGFIVLMEYCKKKKKDHVSHGVDAELAYRTLGNGGGVDDQERGKFLRASA